MKNKFANPYLAGFLLGLTLLVSYLILGVGLGASSGPARVAASVCDRVCSLEYFTEWGANPLRYYLVFMVIGTFLGGLGSAWCARRIHWSVERGSECTPGRRIVLSLVGGVLVGVAARIAQGCTSGQALSGGALLVNGSLLFMLCVFAGGYAVAFFVRGQWR